VKAAGILVAIAVALALQSTLARYIMPPGISLDLGLIVVVFTALSWGPVAGLLTGSITGLAQDALSGGIVGVGGLAKTVVGFVTGVAGTQFIVAHTLPRFLMFAGATALHAACFLGLYAALQQRPFGSPYAAVATQALSNGLLGLLVYRVAESFPGALERRRARRSSLGNRWVNQ
jgi:rod shape-determining protein MreD